MHGPHSHTVAKLAIVYAPSTRHGYAYGYADATFGPNDTASYPFVARIVHGHINAKLSRTDGSYFNATIALGESPINEIIPYSATGEGRFANHYGTFTVVNEEPIPG